MNHPKYMQRAYEALKHFGATPNKGLTVALASEYALREIAYDLANHPANLEHKIRQNVREMFDKYRGFPVLFTDGIYDAFSTMTNEQGHIDCLLSLNPQGHIVEIDGFLKMPESLISQTRAFDLDWGTRHWACVTASCYRDVYTMALSERRKTITTFFDGQIVPELSYKPVVAIL